MNTVNVWLILCLFWMLYRPFELKDGTKNVLRAGFQETPPFFRVTKKFDDATFRFGGLVGNLFNLIADKLKFRLGHLNQSDHSKLLSNGTWTGKIGNILREESDIAVGIMNAEDMKVIDFTSPFIFDEVRFIVKNPAEMSKVFIITRPFGKQLWIFTFISLFLGILALNLLIDAKWKFKPHKNQFRWSRIAWMLFSEMINQGDDLLNKVNIRWMLCGWLLAMAVLIACYEGNLASFMINPGFQSIPRTFSSLKEAVISGEYYIVGTEISNVAQDLKKSNSTLMKTFAKSMISEGMVTNYVECFKRVVTQRCALINYEIVFELIGSKFAGQYTTSNDQLYTSQVAFIVRKNYSLNKNISKVITSAFESGVITKWKRSILHNLHKSEENMKSFRPLNMLDLQGAFYLLFLGHIAGICSLLLEMIVNRCRKCRKSRKSTVFR